MSKRWQVILLGRRGEKGLWWLAQGKLGFRLLRSCQKRKNPNCSTFCKIGVPCFVPWRSKDSRSKGSHVAAPVLAPLHSARAQLSMSMLMESDLKQALSSTCPSAPRPLKWLNDMNLAGTIFCLFSDPFLETKWANKFTFKVKQMEPSGSHLSARDYYKRGSIHTC